MKNKTYCYCQILRTVCINKSLVYSEAAILGIQHRNVLYYFTCTYSTFREAPVSFKDFTTELGSPFSTSHMLLIHRGEMPQNYFQLSQRITVGSQHPLRSQTPVILVPGTQCPLTFKCPLIHVDTRFR